VSSLIIREGSPWVQQSLMVWSICGKGRFWAGSERVKD